MDHDIIESRGVIALRRLYEVAIRDTGQCRYIAHFCSGFTTATAFRSI